MTPPPPPPPPLPVGVGLKKDLPQQIQNGAADRGALLSEIRHGAKLKKASTNDRSSPIVDVKKVAVSGKSGQNVGKVLPATGSNDGPLSFGNLFAQGIPKLRPTNKAFLEGGNYKSQLSAHPGIRMGSSNLNKNSNFQEFDHTKSSNSQPPSPKTQKQKLSEHTGAVARSHDNLSILKVNGSKDSPLLLPRHINSTDVPTSKEHPSSTNLKKTFPTVASSKPNLIQSSYLHQTNGSKWGGSVPNLTGENLTKSRTSSKPLVPPKSTQALSGSSKPSQQWPPERSKSFEEPSEKTSTMAFVAEKPVAEKTSIVGNKPNIGSLIDSSQESRSEPSSLNKVQNGSTNAPLTPSRLRSGISKSIVKPSGAPPPLPTRPPTQNSQLVGPSKQGTHLRNSPVMHPAGIPPQPPPRVMQQHNPEHRPLPPVPTQPAIKPLHSNQKILPHPTKNDLPQKSSYFASEPSQFEAMFLHKFHEISELPKPSGIEMVNKKYPSESAKVFKPNRTHQPPPMAPPPPPPKC